MTAPPHGLPDDQPAPQGPPVPPYAGPQQPGPYPPPQGWSPPPQGAPQGPPQQGWAPPQPGWGPPQPVCRVCGGAPAVDVTIRQHTGMIILMQWRSARGPFCHTCGTSVLRSMTAHTLAAGWWGLISLFIGTPFTLIANLVAGSRLRGLPPAVPQGPQLDPGKPLFARPQAWVPVVVVLVFVLLGVVGGLSR